MITDRQIKRIALKIAKRIFTYNYGDRNAKRAKRLAMEFDKRLRGPGWAEEFAVGAIMEILKRELKREPIPRWTN